MKKKKQIPLNVEAEQSSSVISQSSNRKEHYDTTTSLTIGSLFPIVPVASLCSALNDF